MQISYKEKKDTKAKLLKLFFNTPVSLKTDIYTLMLATFNVSHLSVCIAEYPSLHFKTKLKHQGSSKRRRDVKGFTTKGQL